MPKFTDFKSPLKKLKEDLLGKPPSSSSSPALASSHLETDDALFAESLVNDDNQLRRPMNAFLLFCKRHRQVVRTRHPWLDNRACTKMLADMWGALDGNEKEKYLQLARECKAAFMKAHPGYRWSGPHRHASGKVTQPSTMAPRPTDQSKAGITVGKLADPSQMGGLSLLLLAGQQDTGNKGQAPSHGQPKAVQRSKSAPTSSDVQDDDDDSIKSKLFQFAEMCSDQLAMKPEHKPEASDATSGVTINAEQKNKTATYMNNNTIPLNSETHVSITSHKQTTDKSHAAVNDRTEPKAEDETMQIGSANKKRGNEEDVMKNKKRKIKKEIVQGEEGDKKIKEEEEEEKKEEGMTKLKVNNKKRKATKTSKKKKKKKKKVAKTIDCTEALSASWPGALKGLIKKDNEMRDGYEDPSKQEKDEGKEKGCNDEESKDSGQRKSRRSCKGQLYRKLVDQGMLESLQRPERPFNCKKTWRHANEGTSGFSEAEDEVFQPEDGKKASRRARKRTHSGSSLTCSDFDYGEINVEARLATLPQYTPEQFKTKKKSGLKSKRTSDIYKDAKFIKERGKSKVMRSLSSTELSVTGSQKRKARKSTIMHLLPTKDPPSTSGQMHSSTQKNEEVKGSKVTTDPTQSLTQRNGEVVGSKVKRSLSDPQPFTLSDLADVASMELKPCSSASTSCTPGPYAERSNLCLSAVTVS